MMKKKCHELLFFLLTLMKFKSVTYFFIFDSNSFLRRLDKMMAKIHKNQKIYNSIDWTSVANILAGKLIFK